MTAACVCGREFAKAFGLRVHQRTCPAEAARSAAYVDKIEQPRPCPDCRVTGAHDEGCPTLDPAS